jgi:ribonuclease HI
MEPIAGTSCGACSHVSTCHGSTGDESSHSPTTGPQVQGITVPVQVQQQGFQVTTPVLMQGHQCFVDASTSPDQPNQVNRTAGLGIFFLIMQENQFSAMYIKAKLQACTSVLMAEAAALALASVIAQNLNITGTRYFSDSEMLVQFLNKEDQSNPPDWRIKPFTQLYSNNVSSSSATVHKIHRSFNTTAHVLATQALQETSLQGNLDFLCSSEQHVNPCSNHQALLMVSLNDVTISAARCC